MSQMVDFMALLNDYFEADKSIKDKVKQIISLKATQKLHEKFEQLKQSTTFNARDLLEIVNTYHQAEKTLLDEVREYILVISTAELLR